MLSNVGKARDRR